MTYKFKIVHKFIRVASTMTDPNALFSALVSRSPLVIFQDILNYVEPI